MSDGNPSDTYDGTQNTYGTGTCNGTTGPAAGTYSCGRPNVFQGRFGSPQNPNQYNAMSWLGLPLDPPGTTTSRTIRFTNIRADAKSVGINAPGNFFLNTIQAQISVNGNTSLSINNPVQIVAYVARGLNAGVGQTNFQFLQCVGEHGGLLTLSGQLPPTQVNGKVPTFTFQEGFASSFKAKNIAMILNNAVTGEAGNGTIPVGSSYWAYAGTMNYPNDVNQNVPGAIYNTESGFEFNSTFANPTPNPPPGLGTVAVTQNNYALNNGTGISGAGIADQGTRLEVTITNIPAGAHVLAPDAIVLNNASGYTGSGLGTGVSGIAVRTLTDASGAGAYAPTYTSADNTAAAAIGYYREIPSSGMVVYEVLFADPFSIETATVNLVVSYNPNLNALPNGQPDTATTAQAQGGFAPFVANGAGLSPTALAGLPIPRFVMGPVPTAPNLFGINKCACNLLFPYVTTDVGFDTGIAIANTSMDNLGFGGASAAKAQFGTVKFWFYGMQNGGAAPPSQTTTANVPAGQVLTFELLTGANLITNSTGGVSAGLTAVPGFTGYVIAQSQFQYCHGYAFLESLGQGPTSQGIAEGYLGLLLDNYSWNCNSSFGICRTNLAGENLVH